MIGATRGGAIVERLWKRLQESVPQLVEAYVDYLSHQAVQLEHQARKLSVFRKNLRHSLELVQQDYRHSTLEQLQQETATVRACSDAYSKYANGGPTRLALISGFEAKLARSDAVMRAGHQRIHELVHVLINCEIDDTVARAMKRFCGHWQLVLDSLVFTDEIHLPLCELRTNLEALAIYVANVPDEPNDEPNTEPI